MAFSLSRNVAAAVSLSCRQSLSFSRTFTTSSCLRARLQPPQSPTFYTGRSAFYDYVATLERAIVHTRNTLKTLQLDNLPEFAIRIGQPLVWFLYVHTTKPDAEFGLSKAEPFA